MYHFTPQSTVSDALKFWTSEIKMNPNAKDSAVRSNQFIWYLLAKGDLERWVLSLCPSNPLVQEDTLNWIFSTIMAENAQLSGVSGFICAMIRKRIWSQSQLKSRQPGISLTSGFGFSAPSVVSDNWEDIRESAPQSLRASGILEAIEEVVSLGMKVSVSSVVQVLQRSRGFSRQAGYQYLQKYRSQIGRVLADI